MKSADCLLLLCLPRFDLSFIQLVQLIERASNHFRILRFDRFAQLDSPLQCQSAARGAEFEPEADLRGTVRRTDDRACRPGENASSAVERRRQRDQTCKTQDRNPHRCGKRWSRDQGRRRWRGHFHRSCFRTCSTVLLKARTAKTDWGWRFRGRSSSDAADESIIFWNSLGREHDLLEYADDIRKNPPGG
ncbi:hypothetical protein SK3146_06799 [Paenibacillus konkukensis]|uniref:Uncharacterized protein n=1 Tax=Paenibacillus konkukensis TaxID=2020716 RepID=A0ABY4RZE7_9BACL|nr:hypothetical protein SK3146_06799 [Paenibacillus konkukensis]